MSKRYVGHFFIETWKSNVYLLWDVTPTQLAAWIKQEWDEDWEDNSGWYAKALEVEHKRGIAYIIAIRDQFEMSPRFLSSLTHESLHIAEYILFGKRVRHNEETSEPWAYLVDSIFHRSLKIIMQAEGLYDDNE